MVQFRFRSHRVPAVLTIVVFIVAMYVDFFVRYLPHAGVWSIFRHHLLPDYHGPVAFYLPFHVYMYVIINGILGLLVT